MLSIKLIWSTDPNGYIGDGNNLIFHSKEDLKLFKRLTTGNGNNAVVMGRRTFESLGSKPLPNRLNIVLSKDESFGFDLELGDKLMDLHLSRSIRDVLLTCEQHNIEELWVIGGKEIYEQFIELANEVYVTHFNEYAEPSDNLIQFLPDLTQFREIVILDELDHCSDIDYKTNKPLTMFNRFLRRTK